MLRLSEINMPHTLKSSTSIIFFELPMPDKATLNWLETGAPNAAIF